MIRLDRLHLRHRWLVSIGSRSLPIRRRNRRSPSTLSRLTKTTASLSSTSSTSSSASLLHDAPSLLLDHLAAGDGGPRALDVERILSSRSATASPSETFSSLCDAADLATASSILDFLLHHPVATAAAAASALYLVPRLVRTVTKNVVLPLSALAVLLVCAAAPGASFSAATGLFDLVASHPVAVSAIILAGAAVALSPYLLLVAAAAALSWGVPKLPPPLRPSLPAPLAEARATLGAAVDAASPALLEAASAARSAASTSSSFLEKTRDQLELLQEAIYSPAKSAVAAAERAAWKATATAEAAKAAASAAAGAVGDVGRCRSRPTAAERAACVRQLDEEISRR